MAARSSVKDPLKAFNFKIIIPGMADESTVARFTTCSELRVTVKVDTIRGGGQNTHVEKSPGLPEVADVTLTRGHVVDDENQITSSEAMDNWFAQVHHGSAMGNNDREFRRDVVVQKLRRDGRVAWTRILKDAFPVALAYSESDANATSGNAMETLVLTYERLINPNGLPPPPIGGTNNALLNVG